MTAKANWHLDVEIDQSDPFAAPPPGPARSERVKLDDPDLTGRIVELLYLEGELEHRGLTCVLKDRPESCCSACPLRGSSRAYPIRELCKLGIAQERAFMSVLAADA